MFFGRGDFSYQRLEKLMRAYLPFAFACLATALAPAIVLAQEVVVHADAECVRTGVSVSRVQRVMISAIGTATYGHEGPPVDAAPITTPAGDRFLTFIPAGVNPDDQPTSSLFPIGRKIDPNALLPSFIGALIGRIGRQGTPFYVGAQRTIVMRSSGPLFLCYNDAPGAFSDNTGQYRAVIYR